MTIFLCVFIRCFRVFVRIIGKCTGLHLFPYGGLTFLANVAANIYLPTNGNCFSRKQTNLSANYAVKTL